MSSGRARPARRRSIAGRLAAALALVALSLVGLPGTASASGTVSPLLDCVVANSNGTFTAVLGYSNTTGRTQTIAYGYNNVITPSKYDRLQPTTYRSGTYHGVFKVDLTVYDIYANPNWRLNGDIIDYADVTANACPPATQMPAVGNGTGGAIALLVAGGLGVFLIRRHTRRAGTSPEEATRA